MDVIEKLDKFESFGDTVEEALGKLEEILRSMGKELQNIPDDEILYQNCSECYKNSRWYNNGRWYCGTFKNTYYFSFVSYAVYYNCVKFTKKNSKHIAYIYLK